MINYVNGDATLPIGDGSKLVIHIVNDLGRFGSGFAKAVMIKYPVVREKYIEWSKSGLNFTLGKNQFVKVNDNLWFCNMIAQHGLISKDNPIPIRYDALRSCLKDVAQFCKDFTTDATKWTLHGPRFGSKLAGGNWEIIEKIICDELEAITIYDLR